MHEYMKELRTPDLRSLGMTRWWWYGCAVKKEEIVEQLDEMLAQGIGGVELQMLYPVAADNKDRHNIAYFSPEFFDILDFTSKEAAKRGMIFDVTLGSSWPYGGPFVPQSLSAPVVYPYTIDVTGPKTFSYDFTTRIAGDIVGCIMGKMENSQMIPESIVDLSDKLSTHELFNWPWGTMLSEIEIPEGDHKIVCLVSSAYGEHVLAPMRGADENTYCAAGEKTSEALSGKNVRKVIFSGKTVLIPDEEAIERIQNAMEGAEHIIGIGSGVIQDLCKYVSHVNGIPYSIVATAPSMDGYASTGAAMILGRMKVTVPAGVPFAILADTQVLKDAPMEMIRAGYGDIVGKFSALNDWKLSNIVNNEYFCQELYDLTLDMVEQTLELADGIAQRDEQSIQILMEALVIVGIAMSFAGSSRPASGSEHHLSHFFEITGIVHNEAYLPHGIDVAYSTVITAALRKKLLKEPWPQHQHRLERQAYIDRISSIYGPVADSCIALQDQVGWYQKDMLSVYKAKESEIRSTLAEMPSAEEIQKMLEAVGLDIQQFYATYSPEKIQNAIDYAKELKDRYTVLWMHYDLLGGQ